MTAHKGRELSSHALTHQERHTHPMHLYDSKGFHNTNPHIKREISLLTTYTQEDKGLLGH